MGGRGSSSGVSAGGKPYASQYRTILKSGNIKFVEKNNRESETLMETMTAGRVYVAVGGNELKSIMYFDSQNKRVKTIDLDHKHDDVKPHTHHGYYHNENDSPKGYAMLTTEEKKMVEKVKKIWYNRRSKR